MVIESKIDLAMIVVDKLFTEQGQELLDWSIVDVDGEGRYNLYFTTNDNIEHCAILETSSMTTSQITAEYIINQMYIDNVVFRQDEFKNILEVELNDGLVFSPDPDEEKIKNNINTSFDNLAKVLRGLRKKFHNQKVAKTVKYLKELDYDVLIKSIISHIAEIDDMHILDIIFDEFVNNDEIDLLSDEVYNLMSDTLLDEMKKNC